MGMNNYTKQKPAKKADKKTLSQLFKTNFLNPASYFR